MPQIFKPRANKLLRQGVPALVFCLGVSVWALAEYYQSDYKTRVSEFVEQPIPFSHQHHVQLIGLDCRYCHKAVETSSSAGMPASSVCLTCHSQIWSKSPMLQPVFQSLKTGKGIAWNRVTNLPDFVYFNHSIHVQKGVNCQTCHGKVEEMPLTRKVHSMTMEWCLQCHRNPDRYMNQRNRPFATKRLTDCIVCHR